MWGSLLGTSARLRAVVFPNRGISTSVTLLGKHKKGEFRIKKVLKGDRSSDLAKIPDWSFADGRPAPPGRRQNVNMELQRQICKRIILFRREMAEAKTLSRPESSAGANAT